MLLAFQKGEALRHLGHLDLQRAMQRALRRSGLPVRYTQGFHPHMVMSFASALSMGVSSEQEIVDVALETPVDEAVCLKRMQDVLPQALGATQVVLVRDDHPALMGLLKQAQYDAWLPGADAASFEGAVQAFLNQTEVNALRKTKRGEHMANIRPMVHALCVTPEDGGARMRMRLSLEEAATLKPGLLIETLAGMAGIGDAELPQSVRLRRIRLYGVRGAEPVPLLEM